MKENKAEELLFKLLEAVKSYLEFKDLSVFRLRMVYNEVNRGVMYLGVQALGQDCAAHTSLHHGGNDIGT